MKHMNSGWRAIYPSDSWYWNNTLIRDGVGYDMQMELLLKANVGPLAACGEGILPLIGGGLILNSYLIL